MFAPVQWNAVSSRTNVLRGVHVHVVHWDYLLLVRGSALVALRDLRSGSPTEGESTIVELNSARVRALVIPPGVAHGFYFLEESIHIYSVSEYWNEEDELGCHWADPELQFDWPVSKPELSQRDASAGSLSLLLGRLAAHQPIMSWQPSAAAGAMKGSEA
jgi:dTDP-4-dehydrorhamnose 3,5-epimerase